jgi:hypothetical protein
MLFMTNTLDSSGDCMKNIKFISIILIILSLAFLGCVNPPAATPTPTATPTATETVMPTVVPTTPAPTPTPVPRKPLIYKSFVDQDYGFKRVIEINYRPFVYQNLTLNISAGDTVIWVNDANPDEMLTIVSEQGLWNYTSAILRWNYQNFNYTFTQPGTYGVYIKEYPRKQHQRIIVNP